MKLLKLLTLLAAAHTMLACTAKSVPYKGETKVVHYEDFKSGEFKADGLEITIDKRVDILFVIDDSFSMEQHQLTLANNIDKFVAGLANKSKDIDFHIGVTTVWDNYRYLADNSVVPRVCRKADGTEVVQWDNAGTLKPLKDASNTPFRDAPRFVTNTEGFTDVLKATLKVGAQPFVSKSGKDPQTGVERCAVGPQFEDLFTPMLEAIRPGVNRENEGFRREGAFLVVILVTDAKDGSPLNAEQAYEELKGLTGRMDDGTPKLRVFAVAFNKGDVTKKGVCSPDPAFGKDNSIVWNMKIPDHEVLKLARLTSDPYDQEGQILSLCSNFGAKLSNFTDKIINDVIPDVRLSLPQLSDRSKKLEVSIAGELLIEGQHWMYNPQSNLLTIRSSQVDWSKYRGEQIHIGLTPVVDPLSEDTQEAN